MRADVASALFGPSLAAVLSMASVGLRDWQPQRSLEFRRKQAMTHASPHPVRRILAPDAETRLEPGVARVGGAASQGVPGAGIVHRLLGMAVRGRNRCSFRVESGPEREAPRVSAPPFPVQTGHVPWVRRPHSLRLLGAVGGRRPRHRRRGPGRLGSGSAGRLGVAGVRVRLRPRTRAGPPGLRRRAVARTPPTGSRWWTSAARRCCWTGRCSCPDRRRG